jgi:DNA primase
VPLVEFLLRRSIEGEDLREPDGRARAVRRGVAVLREVGDSLMRHEYALWLSDRTGLDSNEITRELKVSEPATKRRVPTTSAQVPVVLSGGHRIEREALRGLLAYPELFNEDELSPSEDDFTLPVHRSLFRLATTEMSEHGSVDASRILSRVEDPDLQRIVGELSVGETPEGRVARDTLSRLRSSTLDRHIVERKSRLRALDPNREAAAYDALFEELLGLEKKKRALTSLG